MIKNFLKGMVMGVANIIPGVSGGTMAVSMGIYDKLLHCVTHLFKELKESVMFLLPIFVGIGAALVGLSFIIEPAFDNFPLQTSCLFIGLIVGGLPAICKKDKGKLCDPLSFVFCFSSGDGCYGGKGRDGGGPVFWPLVGDKAFCSRCDCLRHHDYTGGQRVHDAAFAGIL